MTHSVLEFRDPYRVRIITVSSLAALIPCGQGHLRGIEALPVDFASCAKYEELLPQSSLPRQSAYRRAISIRLRAGWDCSPRRMSAPCGATSTPFAAAVVVPGRNKLVPAERLARVAGRAPSHSAGKRAKRLHPVLPQPAGSAGAARSAPLPGTGSPQETAVKYP
jgi:hypothetical protein